MVTAKRHSGSLSYRMGAPSISSDGHSSQAACVFSWHSKLFQDRFKNNRVKGSSQIIWTANGECKFPL